MTIKDIARQCGVSVSTVSRVLNDRPDVSPAVRAAVLEALRSSNYVPNNSARDLVRVNSDAVGLVVRGVSNPFFADIIKAIEREIDAAGCTMVMQQIDIGEDEVARGAAMEREKSSAASSFWEGARTALRRTWAPSRSPSSAAHSQTASERCRRVSIPQFR